MGWGFARNRKIRLLSPPNSDKNKKPPTWRYSQIFLKIKKLCMQGGVYMSFFKQLFCRHEYCVSNEEEESYVKSGMLHEKRVVLYSCKKCGKQKFDIPNLYLRDKRYRHIQKILSETASDTRMSNHRGTSNRHPISAPTRNKPLGVKTISHDKSVCGFYIR